WSGPYPRRGSLSKAPDGAISSSMIPVIDVAPYLAGRPGAFAATATERGWTSKVQLEAMDIEGIDVAVVYPSRGLFALTIPDMDTKLAAAMARAYNDWLYEFCLENPERLLGG